MQIAARNGDFTTPAVIGAGEGDYDRDLRWTRALFDLVFKDEEHGDANRAISARWLDQWVPLSLDAARRLQPLWSQADEKVLRFEDGLDRAKDRFVRLMDGLGLGSSAEGMNQ
jgi:propane monooxygenase small subunit